MDAAAIKLRISRVELVEPAIRVHWPDRVPIVFWKRDQAEGDAMRYHSALGASGDGDPSVAGITASHDILPVAIPANCALLAIGGDRHLTRNRRDGRRPLGCGQRPDLAN